MVVSGLEVAEGNEYNAVVDECIKCAGYLYLHGIPGTVAISDDDTGQVIPLAYCYGDDRGIRLQQAVWGKVEL